jgi:hypothetical protein
MTHDWNLWRRAGDATWIANSISKHGIREKEESREGLSWITWFDIFQQWFSARHDEELAAYRRAFS